jgi:hypothetical protein
VFDFTGCDSYLIADLSIETDAVTYPQTCFFLSRALAIAGSNSQFPRIRNTHVIGKFSVAILYNYAAEDGVYHENYWANSATDANAKIAIITASNPRALTSLYEPVRNTSQSCIDHQFFGGQYWMNSATATADCFELDACENVKLYGPWMYASDGTTPARSLIYVNMANAPAARVYLFGFQAEVGNNAQYGILFSATAGTATSWSIFGAFFQNSVRAIFAPAGVVLDNFHVYNMQEVAGLGIQCATLQSSTIDTASTVLNVGTSIRNCLIGDSSRWTITTRQNDNWVDTGATNKSWVPNTSALTGTISVNSSSVLCHGNLVTVTLTMFASVGTLSCAAGTQITGLPFPVVGRGVVDVLEADTPQALGQGVAIGSAIKLPAIAATSHTIVVKCTYFAA